MSIQPILTSNARDCKTDLLRQDQYSWSSVFVHSFFLSKKFKSGRELSSMKLVLPADSGIIRSSLLGSINLYFYNFFNIFLLKIISQRRIVVCMRVWSNYSHQETLRWGNVQKRPNRKFLTKQILQEFLSRILQEFYKNSCQEYCKNSTRILARIWNKGFVKNYARPNSSSKQG